MSVKEALLFCEALRQDTPLRAAVQALGPAASLDGLVRLAAASGFELSEAELRDAFAKDWLLRRYRYGRLAAEFEAE